MYQFVHIETFAREASTKVKPTKAKGKTPQERLAALGGANAPKGMDAFTQSGKGKKPKSSVRDVIGEALRNEGDCNHVEVPQEPTYLVGDLGDMLAIIPEIERKCAAEKERTGRAPRKDMHVLLAGVASYPRELAVSDPKGHERWEQATVKWLREKYGDKLRAVLRHGDEEHPHLHFMVMDRERLNAKELHDGYAASAHLGGKAAVSKEATQLFNNAMREVQSDYYAKVGHPAGLLRDGPKRKRMDRATYKAVQREARERVALDSQVVKAHADLLDAAGIEARTAAQLRRKVDSEAGALAFGQAELEEQRASVKRDRASVDKDWAKAKAARERAEEMEASAKQSQEVQALQMAQLQAANATVIEDKAQLDFVIAARDRELDQLREAKQNYRQRLVGLNAAMGIHDLVRKPELVGMLEYIEQNPDARMLLSFMKSDPEMGRELVKNVREFQAGPGALGVEATWASPQATAADDYLTMVEEASKRREQEKGQSSGMDFGM
jgi:hypothetical protein